MRFQESDCIKIPNISGSIVYFLLDGEEVVYVGQSINGASRPFSHHDKHFTDVMVMPVQEKFLDAVEEHYIAKYSPKYNKVMRLHISMMIARNKIRGITGDRNYSIKDVKRDARRLGVPLNILCNGNVYISPGDFLSMCSLLSKERSGGNRNV